MATAYRSSRKIENKIITSVISRITSIFNGKINKTSSVEEVIDNAYTFSDDIANAHSKNKIKHKPVFFWVSNF